MQKRSCYYLMIILFCFVIIVGCGSDGSDSGSGSHSGGSGSTDPGDSDPGSDSDNTGNTDPDDGEKVVQLLFTEIMYHPEDNDSPEFIELVNAGDEAVDIRGYTISGGIEYVFEDETVLNPGDVIVLSDVDPEDDSSLKDELPDSARLFAPYKGQLNDGGDEIELQDPDGNTVCHITYLDESPWPVSADGFGYSLVVVDQTLSTWSNLGQDWFASAEIGGSPGTLDAEVMPNLGVRINEVLPHTDTQGGDAIELYNDSADEVDISGWYLTTDKNNFYDALDEDDKDHSKLFQIPDGTVMQPNGYLVFYQESDPKSEYDFGDAFGLSAHGEAIFLFGMDHKKMNGYAHGFSFGEVENNITFGRYINASGQIQFIAQKGKTLGSENAGPYVGDIVISEIMYHADGVIAPCDFVEITNTDEIDHILFDSNSPNNSWKISGIDFSFPPQKTIRIDERIVLIEEESISIEEFRSHYNLGDNIQIYTYKGTLKGSRETLELMKPEDPLDDDDDDDPPYMVMDRAGYDENNPGLEAADGSGVSLERKNLHAYGDDYTNWQLSVPGGTPGI